MARGQRAIARPTLAFAPTRRAVPGAGSGFGPGRPPAAQRRVYRFTEAEAALQIRSDRRAFRPYGLYGGQPGRPSTTVFNPDQVLPAKITRPIRRGDVFRHDLPGAAAGAIL